MRQDEFGALYEAHAARLYGFLAYRTGNPNLAEDLLADTFERALRARHRYDPARGGETTWLYAIALNVLRDQARRAGVEARAVETLGRDVAGAADAADDSGDPLAAIAIRGELADAMRVLSAQEREVVALRFGADLTVPALAQVLGVPLTTAEGRLHRALRRLRDALER